jgi:hypothetical protein
LTQNLIKPIWARFNDFVLNIDTIHDLPLRNVVNMDRPWQGEFSDKSKYNDNNYYESPDYWYIRKIARKTPWTKGVGWCKKLRPAGNRLDMLTCTWC